MIYDKQSMFSEHQAITATAASTNVIDLGADHADVVKPNEKAGEINIQVTKDFNNLTNLKAGLQSSTDEAFTSPVTHEESTALLAALVEGYKFAAITKLPEGVNRYVRLYYTVTGTAPTTGKMHAGFVPDRQTNA